MKKYPFYVNDNDDPKNISETVQGLRRLAAYGRIAARALRELKTTGRHEGRVPCIRQQRWVKDVGYEFIVEEVVFPSSQDVTRDDFPEYGNFSIGFGLLKTGWHGGISAQEIGLLLKHQMRWEEMGSPNWSRQEVYLGSIRVKRNGSLSFLTKENKAHKLYKKPVNENAKLSVEVFAKEMASRLISYEHERLSKFVPQNILSLRMALSVWLLEDGHAQRLIEEIVDNAKVAVVMGT